MAGVWAEGEIRVSGVNIHPAGRGGRGGWRERGRGGKEDEEEGEGFKCKMRHVPSGRLRLYLYQINILN